MLRGSGLILRTNCHSGEILLQNQIRHIRACALHVVLPIVSLAQPVRFPLDHITTDQGLSHNTITCIMQDARGFVWIGTIDGLNRFDGSSARVYRHHASDTSSLSSSFIHNVTEDRSGRLWVATRDGGLNLFDPHTGRATRFRHNAHDSTSIAIDKVGTLFEDSRGRLWVTTDAGLCRFDPATGRFARFAHRPNDPSSLSSNQLTGLCEDPDGTLWIATDDGLNQFDPETGRSVRYMTASNLPGAPRLNTLLGVLIGRDGTLWIGTRTQGLFVLNRSTGVFTHLPAAPDDTRRPSSPYISPSFQDADGTIWFGSHDGVQVYDPATGIFHKLRAGPSSRTSLSHSNVSTLLLDSVGDVWIGTWGGGVNKLARRRHKFRPYSTRTHEALLPNDFILAFHKDRPGTLWVATSRGLARIAPWNAKTMKSRHLLPGVGLWSLAEGPDSTIWVGCDREGIAVLRRDGSIVRFMKHAAGDSTTPAENTVRALFRDSKGRIWAGTQTHGINCYDPTVRRWKRSPFYGVDEGAMNNELVWAINEDHQGRLWVGTSAGGLGVFDESASTFTIYRHDPQDSSSLPSNDVRSICVTRTGEVWVGTYGGGICKFTNASFVRVTERDGLANNFVYGILEDDAGNLWISTNRGLSRYTSGTRTFRTYSARDGLQSDEFNTGAYSKSFDGEFFFGGVAGFNAFRPDAIRDNTHVPPIALLSFKVFGVEKIDGIDRDHALRLTHTENFLSFEFAALDFVDPQRNQYAYKLEGFDADWVHVGTRRFGTYTNVDPGEYVLRIKGSNSDGVWNEEGVRLAITIVPPFWMTPWFRVLTIAAAVALVGVTVRFIATRRLKERLRELEKQQALQQERERISRDLHDHVGAQLSSIITGLELAERAQRKPEHHESSSLIATLRDEARVTMAQLRETIWALGKTSMTVKEFFESIEAYAKQRVQHRSAPRLHFVCACTTDLTLSPIQVLHLYRIVQEALNNALKHAHASNITITIQTEERTLTLRVQDDGRTEHTRPADEFAGRGLLNMERRATELQGRFHFVQNEGTTVEVRVPLTPEYHK